MVQKKQQGGLLQLLQQAQQQQQGGQLYQQQGGRRHQQQGGRQHQQQGAGGYLSGLLSPGNQQQQGGRPKGPGSAAKRRAALRRRAATTGEDQVAVSPRRQRANSNGKLVVNYDAPVPGTEQTLDNGAVGYYFEAVTSSGKPTQVFRIISGASNEYMDQIRGMRNDPLSPEQARKRFLKYYSPQGTYARKLAYNKPNLSPSRRGTIRKLARSNDLRRVSNDIRDTKAYNPKTSDYPGLDDGSMAWDPKTRSLVPATKPPVPFPTAATNRGTAKIVARTAEQRRASLDKARAARSAYAKKRHSRPQRGGYFW